MNHLLEPVRPLLEEAERGTFAARLEAVRRVEALAVQFPHRARVRVLRNYTIEAIEPWLKFHAFREDIDATMSFSDFDTFEQEVLDPASPTRTEAHDIIVLTLWLESLVDGGRVGDLDVAAIFNRIEGLIEDLAQHTTAEIVVTSFLQPFHAPPLAAHRRAQDPLTARIQQLNHELFALAATRERVHAIDLGALIGLHGAEASLDRRFWYLYRAPFKNVLLFEMAREIAALVGALKGRSKKVLVLDCDNTLWGGIVGEDGMNGIALDPLKYPGAAFYDFQRQILDLKDQGVLLALCSKNNETDVAAVLAHHPHCLLKADDFAASRVNWQNKARNLAELASTLNLGTDALVFVDDSAVECELIRAAMPEVTVLQVPVKAYDLPALLPRYRGFTRVSRTAEDRDRTRMYRDEADRSAEQQRFADVDSYLRSLNLSIRMQPLSPGDVSRAAQLTQKTNQFNLTTRRYTEGDLAAFVTAPDRRIVTMRVADRFGDYGMTGVAMIIRRGNEAWIDLFLMSCRVLGRKVEYALLRRIVTEAMTWPDVQRLHGVYVPSPKNNQVAAFYPSMGFNPVHGSAPLYGPTAHAYIFDIGSPLLDIPDFVSVLEETVS